MYVAVQQQSTRSKKVRMHCKEEPKFNFDPFDTIASRGIGPISNNLRKLIQWERVVGGTLERRPKR